MDRQSIEKWCRQNSWTEFRQLEDGSWVAFPPGGIIETPLPIEAKLAGVQIDRLLNLVYGSILITLGIIVAAIAIIISPLFLPVIIQRQKQNKSLTKNV